MRAAAVMHLISTGRKNITKNALIQGIFFERGKVAAGGCLVVLSGI